ncbi:unnamed protein product, partial [Ixodes pacificus]
VDVSHVKQFFGDLSCPLNDMLRAEEMVCAQDEEFVEQPPSPEALLLFDWPLEGFLYRNLFIEFESGVPIQKEETFVESLRSHERAVYDSSVCKSSEEIESICRNTHLSRDTWRKERLPRITATKAHKVIRCRGDLQKLAKEMVREVPFSSHATAHGVRYEPEARVKFEEERCVEVHQFGLVVMPEDPWLGCSPDGLFRNDEGKVNLLEIKCPASRWKKSLTEKPLLAYLVEDKHTKIISLRQSHPIYTQIQICLYVLQLEQCELFIYCSVDRKTFHIKRDEAFLSDAIPSLRSF